MASTSEISEVRANTNADPEDWQDDFIGILIDSSSVAGASATIWMRKAAEYAELVDTAEAGARESFSQLHKNALTMAGQYKKLRDEELSPVQTTPRVSVIERES